MALHGATLPIQYPWNATVFSTPLYSYTLELGYTCYDPVLYHTLHAFVSDSIIRHKSQQYWGNWKTRKRGNGNGTTKRCGEREPSAWLYSRQESQISHELAPHWVRSFVLPWLNDPKQKLQPELRAQHAGADCARLVYIALNLLTMSSPACVSFT